MLQLSGCLRSINHLWNGGSDRGVSLVDSIFILLFVSDKEGFYGWSLIPSHHLCFHNISSPLLCSGFQYFFFIPQWNSSVALCALLSLQVQKLFTGQALTAWISQSAASVPFPPGLRVEAWLSSPQEEQVHLNKLKWTMTNPRSFCLGSFYLCTTVKSKIFFQKCYELVRPEPSTHSPIKFLNKKWTVKCIQLCPDQRGTKAY